MHSLKSVEPQNHRQTRAAHVRSSWMEVELTCDQCALQLYFLLYLLFNCFHLFIEWFLTA